MSAVSGDGAPVKLVRQVTRDEVPEGYWLHADHFPFAVTPLSADFNFGKHLPSGFTSASRAFTLGGMIPEFLVVDGFVYGGVTPPPPATPEKIADFEAKARANWPDERFRQWNEDIQPAIEHDLRQFHALDRRALDDAALLAHIGLLSDRLAAWQGVHFTNGQMVTQIMARCRFFCRDHFGLDEVAFVELMIGHSASTSEGNRQLDRLAELAQTCPDVLAALDTPDPWASYALREHLAPYVAEYGHTALDQADYAVPTLAEQPQRLVRLFREALARRTGDSQTVAGTQRSAALAQELRGQLTDAALQEEFDRLLAGARAVYGIRETDDHLLFQGMGLLRYALLEAAERLAARGALASPDHVWFLRRDEFEGALADKSANGVAAVAAARAAEHRHRQTLRPASRFGTPPEGGPPSRPAGLAPEAQWAQEASAWHEGINRRARGVQNDTPHELRGRGASRGVYTGIARVVLQEADFEKVQVGDVLVSKLTYPTWNVLLGRVRAIVTDEGGIMAHAAIVAREFGIPAVVGTRTGTATLTDGMEVTVDGATGLVTY